jgi:hypothetical protein
MAKSLRSKSKRAFRRIKREDPKSDYAIRDKIRVARLSEKLKVLKDVSDSEEDVEEQQEEGHDGDNAMAGIEAEASTSTTTSKPKKSSEKGESRLSQDALAGLCWLLGLLDQNCLTLADGPFSNPAVLRVLSNLSVRAGC